MHSHGAQSPAPEFLDLCDRMGFLVMDELSMLDRRQNPTTIISISERANRCPRYVRRDRNHPSIIVYSAGNEIHDTPKPEIAKRFSLLWWLRFIEAILAPVTGSFRPNVSHDYDNGLADLLDVVGRTIARTKSRGASAKRNAQILAPRTGTSARCGADAPISCGQFLWSVLIIWANPDNAHCRYNSACSIVQRHRGRSYSARVVERSADGLCSRRVAPTPLCPLTPVRSGGERHHRFSF